MTVVDLVMEQILLNYVTNVTTGLLRMVRKPSAYAASHVSLKKSLEVRLTKTVEGGVK